MKLLHNANNNTLHFAKAQSTITPTSKQFSCYVLNWLLEKYMHISHRINCSYDYCCYIIICPIAIAYSMGQIIKSVCVCLSVCVCVCVCVCLSVRGHSHGRISWSIFTKIGTDVRTPKSKNEFVWGQYRTTPSPILLPKTPILGQEVLKTHANIK